MNTLKKFTFGILVMFGVFGLTRDILTTPIQEQGKNSINTLSTNEVVSAMITSSKGSLLDMP